VTFLKRGVERKEERNLCGWVFMVVVCVGTSEETDTNANMACGFAENSPDRQAFSGIVF
jgi:hypothetical protein